MNAMQSTPQTVRIGRREFPFPGSYAEVSAAFMAAVDATGATSSGETGPKAPRCEILDGEGGVVASVSYNGKVWAGDYVAAWPRTQLLFNPYA